MVFGFFSQLIAFSVSQGLWSLEALANMIAALTKQTGISVPQQPSAAQSSRAAAPTGARGGKKKKSRGRKASSKTSNSKSRRSKRSHKSHSRSTKTSKGGSRGKKKGKSDSEGGGSIGNWEMGSYDDEKPVGTPLWASRKSSG